MPSRIQLIDMVAENRDLGLFGDRRPIRNSQRNILIVV
jgi:hypothetical protein